jgi:hypothetical protein
MGLAYGLALKRTVEDCYYGFSNVTHAGCLGFGNPAYILMAKGGWSVGKQVRMDGEGKCSHQRPFVGDFVGT